MPVAEHGYAYFAVFQGIAERLHHIRVVLALADEIEQVGKGLVAGGMDRAHGNIAVRGHHIGKPRIVIEGHGIGGVQSLNIIALEQVRLAPVGEIHHRIDGECPPPGPSVAVWEQQAAALVQSFEGLHFLRRERNGKPAVHIAGPILENQGGKVARIGKERLQLTADTPRIGGFSLLKFARQHTQHFKIFDIPALEHIRAARGAFHNVLDRIIPQGLLNRMHEIKRNPTQHPEKQGTDGADKQVLPS